MAFFGVEFEPKVPDCFFSFSYLKYAMLHWFVAKLIHGLLKQLSGA